ncbi:acyl-CoA N-acyltransferase [Aspergillus leporis]|uniref:Acyl-CoA N-acyltransferase n=1 Tax=Aspergillus leporis TaxID=41062 RepID=A0A5N5XED1_9EURO|nr:acyl-CoA N-acyltransferase [Aspergillus leporis]
MTTSTLPLGPKVTLPTAKTPTPETLPGQTITLTPLDESHIRDLWFLTGGDDNPQKSALWTYLPEGPHATLSSFTTSLTAKTTSTDPLFYTILSTTTSKPLGLISLLSIVPSQLRLEIGWVLFAPPLQRTTGATEAVYLLLRYAFEELGYRRVEWKCNALNEGSRRAALRLGFTFEGVFRQHMVVKGRNRDTAWFSVVGEEWVDGGVKGGLEGWLSEGNFDERGAQRRRLEDIRGEVLSGEVGR